MAIYYRFMSERDYSSMPLTDPFITVGDFKKKVFESNYKSKMTTNGAPDPKNPNGICMGTDLDLKVVHAQSNDLLADDALIPNGTSVLLKRVPGNRRRQAIDTSTIVTGKTKVEAVLAETSSSPAASTDETDFSDFGEDVYAISARSAGSSSEPVATVLAEEDEEAKIRALVNTPALDLGQSTQHYGNHNQKGFGGLDRRTPPQGYMCHRCKVPGHFIQHCPTNGDPNYDFKRMKQPIGIPKSMLGADPDGSFKLPGGSIAVLKPNEDAFDREMEGISSSSRSSTVGSNIPPELCCPLCKQVMKDAVLTGSCCFQSFCYKCIIEHIARTQLKCVCGAPDLLADHLIPNMTIRETIKRMLETNSGSSSSSIKSSTVTTALQIGDDKTSVKGLQFSSTALSAEIPEENKRLLSVTEEVPDSSCSAKEERIAKKLTAGAVDVSEPSQKHLLLTGDQNQPQSDMVEPGKKRRKRLRSDSDADQNQPESDLVEPGKKKRKRFSSDSDAGNGVPMVPWYMAPYATNMAYMLYGGCGQLDLKHFGLHSYIMPYNG